MADTIDRGAYQRIAGLLKQPDDLDKIPGLQSRFEKEKAAIDAQLKLGVKSQMDQTMLGVDSLQQSQQLLGELREEMIEMDKLCKRSEGIIKDFPIIGRVAKIHKNFTSTQTMIDKLTGMHETLQMVSQMIEEDGDDVLDSPMQNLLTIHFHLSSLLDFRDEALYQAKSADEDVQHTLGRYFVPLDQLSARFLARILEIGGGILDIIRAGNGGLIVRTAKILEVESRRDDEIQTIDRARERHADLIDNLRSIHIGWKVPRLYKIQFFEAAQTSTKETFKNCHESFPNDPANLLENLDWIFNDLGLVKVELTHLMPHDWKVFATFVDFYNQETCLLIQQIVESEPDAATILKIVDWIKIYYSSMTELGVTRASMVPKILDGKENRLIDDYLQLIIKKIQEWMATMSLEEKSDFVSRSDAPETDADELYGMQGTVIMFQMISQQIDVAADSGQGRVLSTVISACCDAMKSRQNDWNELLQEEVQKQLDDLENAPGGLLEYAVALANDQMKSADYIESISARVVPLVSKKYASSISAALEDAVEGFVDVAQICVSAMTKLIFFDLKSAFDQIFTSPWYNGNVVQRVVDTIQEYLMDCKLHMNSSLLECLGEEILERTLVSYLVSIRNKNAKMQIPKSVEIIQEDVRLLYGLFASYLRPEDVERSFDPMQQLLNLLSSSTETIDEDYTALKQMYSDVPYWWVEAILRGRDDLDSSSRKALLEVVKRKDKDVENVGQATVMGKLKKR